MEEDEIPVAVFDDYEDDTIELMVTRTTEGIREDICECGFTVEDCILMDCPDEL